MKQIYKITLKPIGSFYFGGEDSFTSAKLEAVSNPGKKAENYFKKRQGYFAKSEMFPQQTQLLGMIRKEMLRHNKKLLYFKNLTAVPKELMSDAKEIVGVSKWKSVWKSVEELDLGAIESLSPLYLYKYPPRGTTEGKIYYPMPVDSGLSLEESGSGYVNGKPTKAFAFRKCSGGYFGAKDHLNYKHTTECGEMIEPDELFAPQVQTHTQTLHYTDDDDEKLFKVKRYTLDEDYGFVCYLKLNDSQYLSSTATTVQMGGEDSYFLMEIVQVDEEPKRDKLMQKLTTHQPRIMLLSDTYIDPVEDIFTKCKVVLAGKTVLRTIESTKDHFAKSTKTILLTKGSILYPHTGQTKEIETLISKYNNFTAIGYNRYITLTKGENNA